MILQSAGPFATVETFKFIYVANCSEDNKIGLLISQSGGQFALSGVQFEVNITVLFVSACSNLNPSRSELRAIGQFFNFLWHYICFSCLVCLAKLMQQKLAETRRPSLLLPPLKKSKTSAEKITLKVQIGMRNTSCFSFSLIRTNKVSSMYILGGKYNTKMCSLLTQAMGISSSLVMCM